MEVNQVRFGNYSIGNQASGFLRNNKEDASETQTQAQNQQVQNQQGFDIEGFFNAQNLAGLQNLAFISKSEVQMPNPADFLDDARINDIEAMMTEFEAGVNNIFSVLQEEFSGMIPEEKMYEFAASMFAGRQE